MQRAVVLRADSFSVPGSAAPRTAPRYTAAVACHGSVSSTSPSSPSGSRKNTLCAEPKSLMMPDSLRNLSTVLRPDSEKLEQRWESE
jgi:hypothetical protein